MPIAFGPTPYYRAPLLSGDAGVEQTINEMRGLVDEALRDAVVLRQARDIVRSVPAFDDVSETQALYNWVRQHVRFTKDPVNKETLMKPGDLVRWIQKNGSGSGDCDDISMLLGTLLMAVGYQARLMTVAAGGDEFSHVYVEGEVNGQWLPMDPARADSQFGVAPPAFTRGRWWSLTDSSYGDLSGFFAGLFAGFGAARHVPPFRAIGQLGHYPRYCSVVNEPAGSPRATPQSLGPPNTATPPGENASVFGPDAGPWQSFKTPFTPGAGVNAGYKSKVNVTPGSAPSAGTVLSAYPRFKAISGWGGLGFLGTAPQQATVNDLTAAGYNVSTINQLLALGVTDEQLQALPYPEDAGTEAAAAAALLAQLQSVAKPATVASPAATTSSLITSITQGAAGLINAAEGNVVAATPLPAASLSLTANPNLLLWGALGLGALLLMSMMERR